MEDDVVTFVQWKGTDLCMDFYCPVCSTSSHFDGFFIHRIQCVKCKTVFEMPTNLPLKIVTDTPDWPVPVVGLRDEDWDD